MNRGRPWTITDRTGGQIDDVFDQLRQRVPGLAIERLEVMHPADDDNVYFIGRQQQHDLIQVDTYPDGQAPFLIENGGRYETTDVSDAVDIIGSYIEHDRPPEPASHVAPRGKASASGDQAEYPADPATISAALVTWTGYGQTAWPQRDEQRLARQLGPQEAADLLPVLRRLEDDFYATNARYVAPDLVTMGQVAAEEFRLRHPHISQTAVEALAWCYTFDYK